MRVGYAIGNPPLAYETLRQEIDIGLLLPCNVIVYDDEGRTVVAAIDAAKMLSVVGNPTLEATASTVNGLFALINSSRRGG